MSEGEENAEKAGCDVCLPPDGLFGWHKYSYKYLCMPTLPWAKGGSNPPLFLGKDERLPLILSLTMGLQHCLAMLAGIATSGGLLITNDTCFAWQKDSIMCSLKSWMVSTAWITSGMLTIIQVFRAKIRGTPYYLGSGLISVMGTSFTFLPIARTMVLEAIAECKDDPDCPSYGGDAKGAGLNGYGKFLGTCLVACLIEVIISFVPPKVLKKLFPPVVTGAAVMLIGGGLIAAGFKYLGGGVFCAENMESRSAAGHWPDYGSGFAKAPSWVVGGNKFLRDTSTTWGTIGPQLCNENGMFQSGFGSPEYVGLGFSVIFASVLCQMFGSPFIKSTFLFWGLVFGCLVSGPIGKDVSIYNQQDAGTFNAALKESKYVESVYWKTIGGEFSDMKGKICYGQAGNCIADAPEITFLGAASGQWKQWSVGMCTEKDADGTCTKTWGPPPEEGSKNKEHTFKGTFTYGFSAEYFLPILIGFLVSTAESIGDIAMTAKYSKVTDEAEVASHIQGGILADGVNSFLAALFGSPPNTTFSQNNGVIALTRCGSRSAGFSCAFWLILFGVFAKLGAAFATIPICVVGGLVLQAFASVFVSGMYMATSIPTRRNQYILMLALGIGLGVAMVGNVFDWPTPHSFYRNTLAYDWGFYPKKKTCSLRKCLEMNSTSGECLLRMTQDDLCTNYNGHCCEQWDSSARSWRTTVIILLKTPYSIGFIVAFVLNLILPEDTQDANDDDKDKRTGPADVTLSTA